VNSQILLKLKERKISVDELHIVLCQTYAKENRIIAGRKIKGLENKLKKTSFQLDDEIERRS